MYHFSDGDGIFCIDTLYTAFDQWIESNYFFVGESHDFWELVIIADGAVGITAGQEAAVMRRGQAVLHPPMEFHRVWYPGERGRIIVISFGARGLAPSAGRKFTVTEPGLPDQLLQQLRSSFTIERVHVMGLAGSAIRGQLAVKELELFLLRQLDTPQGAAASAPSRQAENYARLVRFLEQNVRSSLCVEQIARQCSMSAVSAKQTFSKYAGMGIMAYFNRLKVAAALPLLQQGFSVQEVAQQLGFSSQNYFSTVFKRITGRSPTAFR